MSFRAFLRIQMHLLIVRGRWLLVLPVMGFLSYLLSNAIIVRNPPAFLGQGAAANAVNAWDALFTGFGNATYMTFVIANLFLLLVCDSLPESPLGQLALFRLGSRKSWWVGKSLSMLVAAFVYTLAGMLLLLALTSLRLGFAWEWSQFGGSGDTILVPPLFLRETNPLEAALVLLGMDVFGFWVLGSLMQVVTLVTRRYLFGYFAAMLVLVGSFGISGSLVNVSAFSKLLPVIHNLNLTFYPYIYRDVAMGWSYVYWGVWLLALLPAGYLLSRRQSHYTQQH